MWRFLCNAHLSTWCAAVFFKMRIILYSLFVRVVVCEILGANSQLRVCVFCVHTSHSLFFSLFFSQSFSEVTCTILRGALITTGGGFSEFQDQPSYQQANVAAYLSMNQVSMHTHAQHTYTPAHALTSTH